MTRRSLLSLLLGLPLAACDELRRFHSSASFSVSTTTPSVGEEVRVTFDYLDEAPPGTWTLVLVQQATGAVVDQVGLSDSTTRTAFTVPSPGSYSIELRRHGRMIAHRAITAR